MSLTQKTPFMWAGSKDRDYKVIKDYIPSFDVYHEPFLGGGAVYFRLLADRGCFPAYCTDINDDLIVTYQAIRDDPEGLIAQLPPVKSKDIFQKMMASEPDNTTGRAARFLYLNRNRFFGMGGWMNADRYARDVVIERIRFFHPRMQETDFASTGCYSYPINDGAFVFCDPPYPDTNTKACYRNDTNDIMGLNRAFLNRLIQSPASFLWVTKHSDEFETYAQTYENVRIEKKEWTFRKPGKGVQTAFEIYVSRQD